MLNVEASVRVRGVIWVNEGVKLAVKGHLTYMVHLNGCTRVISVSLGKGSDKIRLTRIAVDSVIYFYMQCPAH